MFYLVFVVRWLMRNFWIVGLVRKSSCLTACRWAMCVINTITNLSSLCIAMLDDLCWVARCNSFVGSWFGSVFGSGCLCVSDLRLYVFRNSVIGFGSFVIRFAWRVFLVFFCSRLCCNCVLLVSCLVWYVLVYWSLL